MDENQNNKQTPDNKENISLYEMLIKQQSLLLQQFEAMTKVYQRHEEKEDEIDLRKLVPGFLRRKKDNQTSSFEQNNSAPISNSGNDSSKSLWKKFLLLSKSFLTELWIIFKAGLIKYLYLVLFFTLIGIGYGIYLYMNSEKIYSSTMIVDSGTISNDFFESLVNKIGSLAQAESYNEISRKLGIDISQATSIRNMYYSDYRNYFEVTKEKTDSTGEEIEYPFFSVTIFVTDNSVLPVFNTALFDYLFNNPYVNEIKEIKKQVLQEQIGNLSMQLSSMDTLKYAVVKRMEKKENDNEFFVQETGVAGGGIILSQDEPLDMSPMLPFEKASDIQRAQLNAKEELLRLNTSFKIIEDFSAISDPAFPRLRLVTIYSIYGFIFGSIISFLLAFIIPFLKKVK